MGGDTFLLLQVVEPNIRSKIIIILGVSSILRYYFPNVIKEAKLPHNTMSYKPVYFSSKSNYRT